MSDILIPIKEFPRCCGLCPCFHAETPMYCQADKTIKMTAPYGKRMEGCPLVEVKEHGDLIDRDYLIAMIDLYLFTAKKIGRENKGLEIFKKEIENAPVIIPSNREGQNYGD